MTSIDWNPVTVEQEIYKCVKRIEIGVIKCDEAYGDFLKKDLTFDVAEAESYLAAEGPQHIREKIALLATIAERDARDVAERLHKLMEKQMKALHAELDALRSIGTSVRQAYANAGRGDNSF